MTNSGTKEVEASLYLLTANIYLVLSISPGTELKLCCILLYIAIIIILCY